VVLIDDIITDGGSKFEAIEVLEEAGLVVKDLVILIDREQGRPRAPRLQGIRAPCNSHDLAVLRRVGAHGSGGNAASIAQSREFIKDSRFA